MDADYKGIRNFPRLCTKLMIEHPFLFDLLKKYQVEAETGKDEFAKISPESIHFGGISAMISKVVARGQLRYDDEKSFNLKSEEVFVAGWMTESQFRNAIDMVDSYKQVEKRSAEKVDGAQRTTMVFPGVTKAFLTFDQAKAYLDEPIDS